MAGKGTKVSVCDFLVTYDKQVSVITVECNCRHETNVEYAEVWTWRNYCTNSITRLDVYVLCKLYTVLGCEIQDLLVFHPPGEE